jgi:hypothetical protein
MEIELGALNIYRLPSALFESWRFPKLAMMDRSSTGGRHELKYFPIFGNVMPLLKYLQLSGRRGVLWLCYKGGCFQCVL